MRIPHWVLFALCAQLPPPHEVLQLVSQVSLQQTPNAHDPLLHSVDPLQASPSARAVQASSVWSHFGLVPEQTVSVTRAPSLLHTCKVLLLHFLVPGTHEPPHIPVVDTQAFVQLVVVVAGQSPLASQVAALTCMRLLEQLALRHWFAG